MTTPQINTDKSLYPIIQCEKEQGENKRQATRDGLRAPARKIAVSPIFNHICVATNLNTAVYFSSWVCWSFGALNCDPFCTFDALLYFKGLLLRHLPFGLGTFSFLLAISSNQWSWCWWNEVECHCVADVVGVLEPSSYWTYPWPQLVRCI